MSRSQTVEERFWNKVETGNGCWPWQGAVDRPGGYGQLYVKDRATKQKAHRVSWEIHNGPIPDGVSVLHRCDVPACVNPSHLFLGDKFDNMRDAAAKNRICTVGKSRLTHCKRGHPFSPRNTYVRPNGHRICRTCALVKTVTATAEGEKDA